MIFGPSPADNPTVRMRPLGLRPSQQPVGKAMLVTDSLGSACNHSASAQFR